MPICQHCLGHFVVDRTQGCRYHPGLFVCRFHPNSARASGDGLGYYGDGAKNDGWPAKFWDCCGSEDDAAPGCSVRDHASFDDAVDDDLYMLRRRPDGTYG